MFVFVRNAHAVPDTKTRSQTQFKLTMIVGHYGAPIRVYVAPAASLSANASEECKSNKSAERKDRSARVAHERVGKHVSCRL